MNKYIYLIRGNDSENHPAFTSRIFELCRNVATRTSPAAMKVTLTSEAPPLFSIIPYKKNKIAAISVVSDNSAPLQEMIDQSGFSGAYKVTEAIPVSYTKDWKDGEQTPGIGLLTLFHRKKGIAQEAFLDRWHNSHTPLSLEIHPLWNYNRNVVEDKVTDHDFWYDGIVEEHFRDRKDLLNIFRFFGKPNKIIRNMMRVYSDINTFLDYKKVETYFVTEYHIIS